MAEKLFMTALSPTMEEGTIVSWAKKEGDGIKSGDVICEVETDKASMDYESTQEGILLKIVTAEGDSAKVGDIIGIIGQKGEDFSNLLETAKQAGAAEPEQTIEKAATAPAIADTAASEPVSRSEPAVSDYRIKASPLARKLAELKGLDISSISGSGPGGRIIKRDLDNAKPSGSADQAVQTSTEDRIIKLSSKRKVIAERLSESMYSAPHYYLKTSVFMDSLMKSRGVINANAGTENRISLNAFIIKLVAETLKRHPYINAGWNRDTITLFGSVDIGTAVALDDGLITPVIRNCGNKTIRQIDSELSALVEKSRNGKLQPSEYTGAGFTISNLGSSGIEEFTAIINPPGSAILALGAIMKTPVVSDSEIVIKQLLKMTLSCDHRVIDGKTGADFLADLKSAIEDPLTVLV